MAYASKMDNGMRVCGCAKWKDGAHLWYVNHHEGNEAWSGGKNPRARVCGVDLSVSLYSAWIDSNASTSNTVKRLATRCSPKSSMRLPHRSLPAISPFAGMPTAFS